MVLLVDLHTLLLAFPANDSFQSPSREGLSVPEHGVHAQGLTLAAAPGEPSPAAARLPSVWQVHRTSAALAVAGALRARGVTAGMCARWWQEAPQRAAERLRGARPLCAEHLVALPVAARQAALDALATLERAA